MNVRLILLLAVPVCQSCAKFMEAKTPLFNFLNTQINVKHPAVNMNGLFDYPSMSKLIHWLFTFLHVHTLRTRDDHDAIRHKQHDCHSWSIFSAESIRTLIALNFGVEFEDCW